MLRRFRTTVIIGNNFFCAFHIQNGLKQGDALPSLLFIAFVTFKSVSCTQGPFHSAR